LSDNDDEAAADDDLEELTTEELTTAATELDTAAAHAISHNQTLPYNKNVQQTDRMPIGMWPALERRKGVTGRARKSGGMESSQPGRSRLTRWLDKR
jgi:hypothetical protein